MKVPLLDIEAQHAPLRGRIDAAIAEVLAHGRFVSGPEVEAFEAEFARFCGVEHAIGCSSGTSALTLALRAAGVGPGDEVVTTAMTFIATVESIVEAGAAPVLVDCEPDTGLMSPERTIRALSPRTRAIVVVHLWGQTVDLEGFRALADARGVALIEDAAQAHGAAWRDVAAGAGGDAAAFSFFPGKNLGALGDAGAVTTRSAAIAEGVRKLRDHGRLDKYRHDELGTNARLDTLQAAVLRVKLERLEAWNQARRAHAAHYDAAFAGVGGVEPIRVAPAALPVYHQYVVRVEDREALRGRLAEHGIATGVHYPLAVSRQPALAGIVDPDRFPAADRLADTVLSLPVYPELPEAARERIADIVRERVPAR